MDSIKKFSVVALMAFTLSGTSAFANRGYSHSDKASPYTKVSFKEGSWSLSESAMKDLRKLVQDANEKGGIEQVIVAAWSDKQLPRKGESLTETDRNLAGKRAEAISNFLREGLEVSSVDTYNMAENANWIARTFNLRDAEIKSAFAKRDSDTPVSDVDFKTIRKKGDPKEAVVITQLKKMD